MDKETTRITIARVSQVSKYLEIWSTDADPGDRWEFAIRNAELPDAIWDAGLHNNVLTHGYAGLVIDLKLGEYGHTGVERIVGRESTMSRIPKDPSANKIEIGDDHIDVRISGTDVWVRAPLSPKLQAATPTQREDYRFLGAGIHWPELDEDLSIAGLVRDATRWWDPETEQATCDSEA